jgi:diguanylate cyclase (GGDEF)-like protein
MAVNPEDTHSLKDLRHDPAPTADASALPAPRPVAPEAYLVQVHPPGPTLGRRALVGRDPVLIGRLAECGVRDLDPSVSRTHARIELRPDGRFQVTDLGSRNGTFVNHARVTSAVLHDGDYLRAGNSIYRFLAGGNIEAGYHEEIHRLTVTDPLTGLANRRSLNEFLDREVERARRYARPLSLLLIDIDHFKLINARFGHIAGDLTLRAVAEAVRPLVRKDELLARYGGEEFALVLPEADAGPAGGCGERVRRAVGEHPFEFEGVRYRVTVSVGVGTAGGGEVVTVDELVRRAGERLSEAKAGGRDRVCPGGQAG